MSRLIDYCTLIRSKNAGPFVLTFDFMFKDLESLRKVQQADVITKEFFAKTFHTDIQDITLVFHERALAAKVSIPRPHFQGEIEDGDYYGGQQYAPLLDIPIAD
jgi:hypothetical protein